MSIFTHTNKILNVVTCFSYLDPFSHLECGNPFTGKYDICSLLTHTHLKLKDDKILMYPSFNDIILKI